MIFLTPVLILLFALLLFGTFFVVKQQTSALIERFGKYVSTRQSGLQLKIPIIEFDDLLNPDFILTLESLEIDIFIIVAFKILPKKIFSIPKHGTVNLHASLLPK